MTNPLTMKLEQFTSLSGAERQQLDEIFSETAETYAPGQTIIADGEAVRTIHLVLSGLAARSKDLPDGGRQIMAFLIPGDLCDLEVFVLEVMDHDLVAVSETTCAVVAAARMEEALTQASRVTKALWWSTMTDSAVLRERIIDHGRRGARERIAHLLYEMLVRYRVVGRTSGDSFPFPVTQQDLADATGLTAVHVNRTLKLLREDGLVDFREGVVTVLNPRRLKSTARFDAAYLHLDRAQQGERPVSDRVGDLI